MAREQRGGVDDAAQENDTPDAVQRAQFGALGGQCAERGQACCPAPVVDVEILPESALHELLVASDRHVCQGSREFPTL